MLSVKKHTICVLFTAQYIFFFTKIQSVHEGNETLIVCCNKKCVKMFNNNNNKIVYFNS